MNPASTIKPRPTGDTSVDTAARPETAAVGASAPELPAMREKPTTPGLLNITLKLPQGSGEGEAESGIAAAPRSPSARVRTKAKRSTTETRGQKRAIDGRDGPGLGATSSPKRPKDSPAPDSPRGGSPSGKQLVKATRPVADLKAMLRQSPRAESVSPPLSPRAPTTPDQTDTGSPRRASNMGAPPSSTTMTLSGSAPRWRSASYGEMPEGPTLSSPRLSPRIGSMAGMHVVNVVNQYGPGPRPGHDAPPTPASLARPGLDDIGDFTFSDCDFGEDGMLALTQAETPRASASADKPALLQSVPNTLKLMITAEVGPMAQAQKDAAAAYLLALDGALSKASGGKTLAVPEVLKYTAQKCAFETAQASLETTVMLADMALNQGDRGDASRSLEDMRGALARCRTSLMALAGSEYGKAAGEAMASPQAAATASLQSLEDACSFSLQMLADQPAADDGSASTASTAAQGRLVLSHSTEQLLDELDVLLDEEIPEAAPATVGKSSGKPH